MTTSEIKITFDGLESSEALKNIALEKMGKYENFLLEATSAEVIMVEEKHAKGVSEDFKVTINVTLPGKGTVHVDESGEDMYVLLDSASDILFRRIRKMSEKQMDKDR